MKIIIVGCGKIGTTLIEGLVSEGHDVTAIDSDPEVISSITDIYDVIGVCGNGVDCLTLEEAGVHKADLFASVTGSDEMNMLSCFIAGRMGAAKTIARIRNPEYNSENLGFLRHELGLAMAINPEKLVAREIFDILKLPSAVKIETFARHTFEMIEMILKEDSGFCGMKLSDLRYKYNAKFLVCVVQRGDKVYIPDGSFELKSGDKIGLTAAPSEIQKLFGLMGMLRKKSRNVMIIGCSRTAYYLSKMLTSIGIAVKIIDIDPDTCREFSEKLPKVTVINADGADQEMLAEEGIGSMDAFVSLTGMDEENILFSFFASSKDVPKVIPKVNKRNLDSIASKLGIDCTISPKTLMSDVLVRYARALENSNGSNVETLYKLMDGNAEAVEFIVRQDFRAVGVPLKDLKTASGTLIAGIIRDRKPIIPAGDDMILEGDRVIVIAAGRRLQDLSDILAR